MISDHISHEGLAGTATSISATVISFTTAAYPILQVFSAIVAITAGITTIIWYWKQIRTLDMKAAAAVAAAEVLARARIAAAKLEHDSHDG